MSDHHQTPQLSYKDHECQVKKRYKNRPKGCWDISVWIRTLLTVAKITLHWFIGGFLVEWYLFFHYDCWTLQTDDESLIWGIFLKQDMLYFITIFCTLCKHVSDPLTSRDCFICHKVSWLTSLQRCFLKCHIDKLILQMPFSFFFFLIFTSFWCEVKPTCLT